MGSFCARCGREAELLAGSDGGMYCNDCLLQSQAPRCIDCVKCHIRRCGDAIYACPFCSGSPETADAAMLQAQLKKERILAPIRIDEKCERCGGTLPGRAFIMHGKALCRDCLLYEQDRWEVVSAKPGKGGSRIRVVIERPKVPTDPEYAKKLFHAIGADPENLPPDPFSGSKPINEKQMPDDSCVNCEAYAAGKIRGKFLGGTAGKEGKKG
jgi:ribosomal protein S14